MRAIDLFAGWGGFTLGAHNAGVEVIWAANHWPTAVATHKANHPGTTHACQDLKQADWTNLEPFDLLLASPACQGHSTASQPKRRAYHDALRATAMAVVDCADVCNPTAIVVENVPSFRNWRLYGWWRNGLEHLGYQLEERLLTASNFGVPQRRTRLFVIATRPGVTVPDARQLTTKAEPGMSDFLQPNGHRWHNVNSATAGIQSRIRAGRSLWGSRFITQHTTGHKGIPLNEPLRTVTTAPNHWNLVDGNRYRPLSGRELARAMGFPDSYQWDPTLSVADVTKGLGNAVCPPVAEALVSVVADAAG